MAKQVQTQETFEQALTRKRNTVLELELNARYWKAQYELKHYTIEENKLREAYNAILQAKEQVLQQIDEEVKGIEQEVTQEAVPEERVPESDEQQN